jgi:hypothetical protein
MSNKNKVRHNGLPPEPKNPQPTEWWLHVRQNFTEVRSGAFQVATRQAD